MMHKFQYCVDDKQEYISLFVFGELSHYLSQ